MMRNADDSAECFMDLVGGCGKMKKKKKITYVGEGN